VTPTAMTERERGLTGSRSEPTGNRTEPTENRAEPTENNTEPTGNRAEPTENNTEPTGNGAGLDLVVETVRPLADEVLGVSLVDPAGRTLPVWTPGAHVDLVLAADLVRSYSLCGDPSDRARLRLAVLREPDGRGGSAYVHERLQPGTPVRIRGPRNHFPLVKAPRYLFLAGGIGITPLLPMLAELAAGGADWQLVYLGRTRSAMAFLDDLTGYGERVRVLAKDEIGPVDLGTVLDGLPADTAVYCCGPPRLLADVERRCAGMPPGTLHLERFTARPIEAAGEEHPFEVVLARSGVTVQVPAGRSVFDAVQDAGISVLGSCHEGICGTCEQAVLEGEIDHRDSVLTTEEQAANDVMMICVSRGRSDRLVIDL